MARRRRSSSGASAPALTLSAAAAANAEALYKALETKVAGAIRSAVSSCSHVAQSVLVKAIASDSHAAERQQKKEILEACGPESPGNRRLASSSPTFGSPIPSMPATLCA